MIIFLAKKQKQVNFFLAINQFEKEEYEIQMAKGELSFTVFIFHLTAFAKFMSQIYDSKSLTRFFFWQYE